MSAGVMPMVMHTAAQCLAKDSNPQCPRSSSQVTKVHPFPI